ncbi:hypothetical protein HDU78_003774 [Chytriomyces hyalinus]|nr:hypothetical protein HDU78_003774 [Chytriomyces hyalinus]
MGLIIGGVVGGVAFLALVVAFGIRFCQKRILNQADRAIKDGESSIERKAESIAQLPPATPPAPKPLPVSVEKATVSATLMNEFPVPEKSQLLNNLVSMPNDMRKFENASSLKASLPGNNAFTVSPSSVTVSETKMSSQSLPAPSNSQTRSSAHQRTLPANPQDWNQYETAQWILERFGNAELSALALRQKINGRVLLMLERQDLKSDLGLETVGERLLFEEAVAELREQSAQQNAFTLSRRKTCLIAETTKGVVTKGKRVKVSWGKAAPTIPAFIYSGSSKRLQETYVGPLEPSITEERLRQDFSYFGEVEMIHMVDEKTWSFVSFTKLLKASRITQIAACIMEKIGVTTRSGLQGFNRRKWTEQR